MNNTTQRPESKSREIAHSLSDSATVIKGFSSLVEDDLQKGVIHREHINCIISAADRTIDLTRQLMQDQVNS